MTSEPMRGSLASSVHLPDGGTIVTAGDPGWDDARLAFNLAVDQQPAAVALPRSAPDVAAVVDLAGRAGLRVSAQGTGHGSLALGPLADTILVKTDRMRGVEIDPDRRRARVQAGAIWQEVADPAAEHGLAALAGSSPDVGVVGYTLGGGMSWLGRRYGLAVNSVTSVELVTPDGRIRRVDADHDAELFWAVRGGGGNFGVVTAIELELYPVPEVYAGVLWWPMERGAAALHAWRDLTAGVVPDELTTVGRYLQLPDMPEIPEPVRGRSWAIVEVIHLGTPAEADRLLAPLRALNPVMDTISTIPVQRLSALHMDPEQPVPYTGDGTLLADLPAEAVDELIRVAGPGSGSPLLSVEVRQLGGALARPRPDGGAVSSFDAAYALYAVGITPVPPAVAAVRAHVDLVLKGMNVWSADRAYLNFSESTRDPAQFWPGAAGDRLRQVKARIDPADTVRGNHLVAPAG